MGTLKVKLWREGGAENPGKSPRKQAKAKRKARQLYFHESKEGQTQGDRVQKGLLAKIVGRWVGLPWLIMREASS